MVKEKFSKLLLGEDMSGTGKGVSSALALSNAITNLAGNSFSLSGIFLFFLLFFSKITCFLLRFHYLGSLRFLMESLIN